MKFIFRIDHRKYNLFSLIIQIIFFTFATIIIIQLAKLQIFDSSKLKEKAKNNRQPLRTLNLRGEIIDRKGVRLASDITLYDIYAHPRYYNVAPKEMAFILSKYLKQPEEILYEKLKNMEASTITIAKNIDSEVVEKEILKVIRKLKIRGLDFVKKNERVYPQGNLAAHILGYVNFDANLFAGVEKTGSKNLEKLPNVKPFEYDGKGNIIYDFNTDPVYTTSPLRGEKLTLTIDSVIQHIAESELLKMMKKTKAERGSVIVLNPKSGEILGFVVLPSYDPNKYLEKKPSIVKNWVLSDVYPPGSTFKIITVASALESKAIYPRQMFLDTGKIKINNWTIRNYDYNKKKYPVTIGLKDLFSRSSNIASLKVALEMSPKEFYGMLKKFGIGKKTGIDLPGESAGIMPKLKTWDKVRQGTIGFGYSIATTPLQVASAVSAIANDGVWVTPHVIKYSNREYSKRIKTKRVLSKKNAKIITDLLATSIQESKSKAGKIPNYLVAGKTGTSRKPNPKGAGYLKNQLFTSFVGYFPAKNPEILIMVVVDNPKGRNIWGSTIAGPVFNSIAQEVARVLNLKYDAPGINVEEKAS